MTALTRRQAALLGLLLVAIVVVIVRPGFGPQAEDAQAPSNRVGDGETGARPNVPVVDLKLERLRNDRGELPESERNPFRFRPMAPPPPPPPPPRAADARTDARPEPFVPPAGPPPPPPIPLKFFGLLEVRGERVAAFADGRGNQFQGKEGDIIEGRYRVLRIGADSVDLAHIDGRGHQTIRLTGQ